MTLKPRLLVTRRLPAAVEARASRDYDVRLNADDRPMPADEIVAASMGRDGLIPTLTDRLDAALIGRLPDSVRIVSTFSVGFEHIDLEAARARGIVVTNTPGVLTEATAEIAFLLLLGAARRAWEGESLLRAGAWTGWTPTQLLGTQLTGKRLGILGMGRIGQAVAARGRAFAMTIHYHNRNRLPPDREAGAVFHADPEGLLKVSDFLSLHCPLTPETRHFLDARRLALLPEGAVVVNTARGPVVDDAALVAALRTGRVAAAGLDVYEGEPALHPGYRDRPNAFLLPHLGSATVETRNAMGFKALDNLDAFFAGRPCPDRVA
ncbi:MAG: D-glycerate dehydrogenase [Magnetospirillum sp. WYHS-4]